MPFTPLPQSLPRRPRPRAGSLLGAVCLLIALATALAGPAAASPATPGTVTRAAAAAVPAAPAAAPASPAVAVPVRTLTLTGTATSVTVRRVYRKGQVQWISHVLDTRLVGLDGCQARRSPVSWSADTYRAVVRSVCTDGPARPEAAAKRLVADRPWYLVRVSRVPLVGFSLGADLPRGNDRAFPAALAQLPKGQFTFAEGDDLSISYVGAGVTQAQLDAAVTAFASALGVTPSDVTVTPLAE